MPGDGLTRLWVYLEASPLLGLTITLAAYSLGAWIYDRAGRNPLCNPVLIAVVLLAGFLIGSGTPYSAYFEGAQFVHFLLGPATVALAVPLWRNVASLRKTALAVTVALLAGSAAAVGTAIGVAWLLGASPAIVASLAPKSVTTPIAMGLSEGLGGLPSLTAVLVILTGILGASLGPPLMNLLRVRDMRARGLALGVASHGIGTARALQVNEAAGAYAGLGMGMNAVVTSILLPLAWAFLA